MPNEVDQVVVLAGASSGIGRRTALEFAASICTLRSGPHQGRGGVAALALGRILAASRWLGGRR
jgi:NAD(P)-dependent dehydrogenase (short-subunit alcohol dehydrogenase family)